MSKGLDANAPRLFVVVLNLEAPNWEATPFPTKQALRKALKDIADKIPDGEITPFAGLLSASYSEHAVRPAAWYCTFNQEQAKVIDDGLRSTWNEVAHV